MKKKDLQQVAGISSKLIAKMGRNENVSTDYLAKICMALHCDVGEYRPLNKKMDGKGGV